MENSILNSVKKMIGIMPEYTDYDDTIIAHINTIFMNLNMMGIGPENYFSISDDTATWDEFITGNSQNLEAIRTYVGIKVRLMFDPPSNSFVIDSLNKQLAEIEYRIYVIADNRTPDE